jgi:hypothetical protein
VTATPATLPGHSSRRTATPALPVRQPRHTRAATAVTVSPPAECVYPRADPGSRPVIGITQYLAADAPLIGMLSLCECGTPIVRDALYGWMHQSSATDASVIGELHNALL